MPTLTAPLFVAATYRGTAAGWIPLGAPRPLAQAEALASLAARIRPELISKARPAQPAAAAAPKAVAPAALRRWHPGDTHEVIHGLGIIAATYGLAMAAMLAMAGAHRLATGTPATAATPHPVATLAT